MTSAVIFMTAAIMCLVTWVAVAVVWIRSEVRKLRGEIQKVYQSFGEFSKRPVFDKMSPEEFRTRLAAIREKEASQ